MKKVLAYGLAIVAAGFFLNQQAMSDEGHQHGQTAMSVAKATETKTLQGEILDMSCYIGEEAHGAKHKGCAVKCLKSGASMGLLTSDGQVYLLVEDHGAAKVYSQLKNWAA